MIEFLILGEDVEVCENFNLHDICTSIDVSAFADLLKKSQYDHSKTEFLIRGFKHGFDLEYKGPLDRQDKSQNIPFHVTGVGDTWDMWEKINKEVKLGRFAGPYEEPPFKSYVQSPIGLVPKNGGKTRLIFHLSYNFKTGNQSVNSYTPPEACTVQYNDLDSVIRSCLRIIKASTPEQVNLYLGKSDLVSAFRVVPVKLNQRWLLILKAAHPVTNKIYYYVDKNLPFGHSISCKLFQSISDAIRHILEFESGKKFHCVNYLDDYLFIQVSEQLCNNLVSQFLEICQQISFPVSLEKTEWASLRVEFLGMLIDGEHN